METNKRVLFVFAVSLLLVSLFSSVLAVPSENATNASVADRETKNMTYGQCVSQNAAIKNDCYISVKSAYSSCKNNTTDRKICSKDFKADLAQCKKGFKSAKSGCGKIKHNFFETARYSLI